MKFVISALFFALAVFDNVNSRIVGDIAEDLKNAVHFISCARQTLVYGLPEADIPSHNPLIFKENISYSFDLLGNTINFQVNNAKMGDIPFWTLKKAVIVNQDDPNVDAFNFDIYWPDMFISADYKMDYVHKDSNETNELAGEIYMELDHVDFDLLWTSTKPHDGVNGTLDDVKLKITTKKASLKVSNLGVLSNVIKLVGGTVVKELVNANLLGDSLGEQLKEKVIRDWVQKPERIDAIMANCDK